MKNFEAKAKSKALAYEDFFSELHHDLESLKENHLYRECRVVDRDGVRARIKDHEVILFCGNDYLGLASDARVIAAAAEALKRYGVGSGAARLVSGTSPCHARLEEKIAAFKNKEKAVLFTAGYMANLGTLAAFCGGDDLIVMDKLCHASLIDGAKLSGAALRVFPHKNYARCREILKKVEVPGRKFLVSDTVFSMDGDFADVEELIRIKKEERAILILDDSHGTGVLGKEGRGLTEGFENSIDVILGTFSKALGCVGGFAAGSAPLCEYLVNHSRPFIFATALPPAICAAAAEAIEILEADDRLRIALWENIQALRQGLERLGFSLETDPSPVIPVILGEEKKSLDVSGQLFEKGFFIPAIRSPTVPKGKSRLRITVSALHKKEDISRLLSALAAVLSPAASRKTLWQAS